MNFFQSIFIGVLQGITEWLPISSSGQVMLTLINFFKIPTVRAYDYSLILHLGTLLALIFKFRKELIEILINFFSFQWTEKEKFLFYSTIFTALLGLPLYKIFKLITTSFNPEIINGLIGLALILTGLILWKSKKTIQRKRKISFLDSMIAGLAQGLAIIPGISRSGMTTGSLLLRGINQEKAIKLSFLMAVPAIVGALILELPQSHSQISSLLTLSALFSSFLVSFLMIEAMMKVAKSLDFSKFCFFFGLIALLVSIISLV